MRAPNELITYHQATTWGPDFRTSRRSAAHLDWTKAELATMGKSLRILQPSYNVGYAPSAGTHNGDACFDVAVNGMSYADAQHALRRLRWAAWWRTPAQGFSDHIHMVSVGCNLSMVGSLVPAQLADYRNDALGLQDLHWHGSDPSWHPFPILAFDPDRVGDHASPAAPTRSEWDHGDVHVERLRRRHNGQRILDSDSIRRVQYRLLNHPDVPALAVKINGWWDDGTISAVRFFQRMVFDATDPDNADGDHLTNRQTNRLMGRHGAYNVIEEG